DKPQTEAIFGDWNRQKISKAYLDEDGDPYVEFSINMLHGVSRENFTDTLNWFAMEMAAFMDQVGWSEDDKAPAQPI
ncbi:MAG: YbjN domain-containing protein, partial [Henriciella sp.]